MDEANVLIAGRISVDPGSCFTDSKGRARKGIEKRVRRWLEAAAPLLAPILEPGEVVRMVTPASSPYSLLEILTTGWIIVYVKRCLLVVTDRRILHIPTTQGLTPRQSIAEMRFGDLEEARVKGLLSKALRLTYRGGKREIFRTIPSDAGKCLEQALARRDPALHAPSPGSGGRRHLCPGCGEVLDRLTEQSRCPVCGLRFKDRKRAVLLSVVFPGGGYFYTGHPILGLADAVVEGGLLFFLIASLVQAANGDPELGWANVAVFGAILAIEKLVTIYHAGHYLGELLPADRAFRPSATRFGPT